LLTGEEVAAQENLCVEINLEKRSFLARFSVYNREIERDKIDTCKVIDINFMRWSVFGKLWQSVVK
jgi:hypothetical protein